MPIRVVAIRPSSNRSGQVFETQPEAPSTVDSITAEKPTARTINEKIITSC